MKNTIKIKNTKRVKENVVATNFASDFFKCSRCGYTVRMLVRGDRATCSQCGGTMYRC